MYTCLVDKDWNFTFVVTRDYRDEVTRNYRNKYLRMRYLNDNVYYEKQLINSLKNYHKRRALYKQDRLHIQKNINGELVTVFKG